ncbi:MAG: phosphoribosylamine--glycine ligase [Chloroflexota bacterium]
MKVLVVGNGGREHAIVWRVIQSPLVDTIYCAPGNAGTALMAHNVPIPADQVDRLLTFALENEIDLTIVGPEAPLIAGLADRLRATGRLVFGPGAAGARLEGSKAWTKALLQKYAIPCAHSESFTDPRAAADYVRRQPLPVVVKADGQALGKGVTVAQTHEEALAALRDAMESKIFGAAGETVVVEECLRGPEVSALAFTDGETLVPMVPACDYKRVYDGDLGPNTGGMGSYSPPGFVDEALAGEIRRTILEPTVAALRSEGIPYQGVLYAGIMLTADGPKVLEYNARFGDPETQVILPRLRSDLVEILLETARGRLAAAPVAWDEGAACGVVLAAGGYPGQYAKGLPITGLDELDDGILAFHAGTRLVEGKFVTNGGRVLALVGTGANVAAARARVYANVERVRFEGVQYRRDIGAREVTL